MSIDLAAIGRELKKPVEKIESAVKLLDDGNTIPFITRFRKDQTGGLTEEQLLVIKTSVARLRALDERKTFITKSIDSQGKLTPEITSQLSTAQSSRELEDIYLPFKPKKQTLATVAKQNGLEPLAMDIFEGREPEKDLASRATDFVRVDKNLNSVDDVIAGVGHILAEKFSDRTELRNSLRSVIAKGKLLTTLIEEKKEDVNSASGPTAASCVPENPADSPMGSTEPAASTPEPESTQDALAPADSNNVELESTQSNTNELDPAEPEDASATANAAAVSTDPTDPPKENVSETKTELPETNTAIDTSVDGNKSEQQQQPPVKKKKKKKKKKTEDPYKEFHDFSHPIAKMPYHKILAINRGEKNGRLKVKIQYDDGPVVTQNNAELVADDHPFNEFLCSCMKDAMVRMVVPSLERDVRREITEAAEKHAVSVFARNLKNLLLQSPVREHCVLAIDPGYKRGCSVVVMSVGGELLEHAHIFVVGNETRRVESKQKLIDLVNRHSVSLIAIGNGAACREAEQLVSDIIKESFTEKKLKYAIVNEAGASFYSTSEVGREEFPDLSPAVRSAISIGRRLIDPLSELVKISPANIGVGLYQHDVKAKHLSESLDDVVQFCVNRVGVDVNTASVSLLKYVSGLNQLTARRIFEYRQENGPFKNREQLKQVTGFGDATFVQSAGFLRVHGGDQPLDTTAIHPEFYEVANKIIAKVGADKEDMFPIATAIAESEIAVNEPTPTTNDVAETNPPESTTVEESVISANEPTPATDDATETNPPETTTVEESEITANEPIPATDDATETNPPESTTDEASKTTANETTAAAEDVTGTNSSVSSVKSAAKPKPAIKKIEPQLTQEQIDRRRELVKAVRALDAEKLAAEFNVGRLLIRDILHSICRPEYDPRINVNRPVFRSGIIKLDDLSVDMCLDAQVVNVVDFGVFVDIGLGTSCLVHVSQLANHFIRDPHRFYAVGDSLKVWVTDVELEKRRVKLTAVQPKSQRPERRERKQEKSFKKTRFKKSSKPPVQRKQFSKPRRKPKPVKPITDDMLKGSEPMRSFSDLAQFFNKQPDEKSNKESS